MAKTITQPREAVMIATPVDRRITPVKWWAGLGVLFTLVAMGIWGAWLLSGPERTPPGTSTLPTWMRICLDIQLWGGLLGMGVALYFFLIRPWRRAGALTLDGMFVIAFLLTYWQDPMMNSLVPYALYNSRLPNWGSWAGNIPWWHYPNGRQVTEPILWDLPVYIYALFGVVVLGGGLMRKCKERWPQLSKVQLVGICFVFMALADLLIEPFWIRTGIFVFNGVFTPSWLTLFDGRWYQFPLSEPVMLGAWWTLLASLRYFKNDLGETIVERGALGDPRIPPRQRTWLRLFAVIAAANLCLLCYTVPAAVLGLYIRSWPEDVYTRSYFTNSLCGPGTSYACPGPNVPIPVRNESIHVGPDGSQVVPPGTHVPDQVSGR